MYTLKFYTPFFLSFSFLFNSTCHLHSQTYISSIAYDLHQLDLSHFAISTFIFTLLPYLLPQTQHATQRQRQTTTHIIWVSGQLRGLHGDVELWVVDGRSWGGEADPGGSKGPLLITEEEGERVIHGEPFTQCRRLGVQERLRHVNQLHPRLAPRLLERLGRWGEVEGYSEVPR